MYKIFIYIEKIIKIGIIFSCLIFVICVIYTVYSDLKDYQIKYFNNKIDINNGLVEEKCKILDGRIYKTVKYNIIIFGINKEVEFECYYNNNYIIDIHTLDRLIFEKNIKKE